MRQLRERKREREREREREGWEGGRGILLRRMIIFIIKYRMIMRNRSKTRRIKFNFDLNLSTVEIGLEKM